MTPTTERGGYQLTSVLLDAVIFVSTAVATVISAVEGRAFVACMAGGSCLLVSGVLVAEIRDYLKIRKAGRQ